MQSPAKLLSIFLTAIMLATNSPLLLAEESAFQQPSSTVEIQEHDSSLSAEREQEFIKVLSESLIKSIITLEIACEHCAEIINNNQVRNINKKECREYLQQYRLQLAQLRQHLTLGVGAEDFGIFIVLLHEITQNLTTFIQSGLKSFPLVNIEELLTRGNIPELDTLLANIENALPVLNHKVDTLGISFMNRLSRKVANFSKEHYIASRLGKVALYSFIGALIVYWLDHRYFELDEQGNIQENPTTLMGKLKKGIGLSRLKQWIGSPLERKNTGLITHDIDPQTGKKFDLTTDLPGEIITPKILQTKFAHFIDIITRQIPFANFTVPTLITFGTFSPIYLEDWHALQEWLSKIKNNLSNRLQGYHNNIVSLALGQKPRFTFDDIIGNDHNKELLNYIVDYICDYEKYDRMGMIPPSGIIFAGKPRSGKSMAAEAIAGEIQKRKAAKGDYSNTPFLAINLDWLLDKTGGAISFKTLIESAQIEGPMVLFVDEADMLGLQREQDKKLLADLLTAMSGYMANNGGKRIVIIFATNKPENLDFALREHGRFGTTITFEYPNYENRKEFLKKQLYNRTIMLSAQEIEQLALQLEDQHFDMINAVISRALQQAKMRNSIVMMQDFEEAIDLEVRKILPKHTLLDQTQQHIMATHLAGHTLASVLLNGPESIVKVTLNAVTNKIEEQPVFLQYYKETQQELLEYGKVFYYYSLLNNKFKTYDQLINECKIYAAGHCAEHIVLGSSSYTYHNQDCNNLVSATKFLVFNGVKEEEFSKEIRQEKLNQAQLLADRCQQEATALLIQHKDSLIALRDALIKNVTLNRREVMHIIRSTPSALEQEKTINPVEQDYSQENRALELAEA